MTQRKEDAKRRQRVAEALDVLRDATGDRVFTASKRIQVARAYRVLGDYADAAGWYRSAVDELSSKGDAVKALALAKEMAEVVPQEQRAFANLADRFSGARRDLSARVAVPLNRKRPRAPEPEQEPEPILDASELLKVYEAEALGASLEPLPRGASLPSLVPPDVLEELHERGEIELFDGEGRPVHRARSAEHAVPEAAEGDFELIEEDQPVDREEVISALSRVPLFSDLDRGAFVELARAVKLRTVGDRCEVFREGEEADSFFLLAEGNVEVVRRKARREVVLRHFGQGEAFGIFGLSAGQRRAATVRAIGNATVLEIPAGGLANVLRAFPRARAALSRFYQERLLENFLASSPLFDDLDAIARGLLIGQFREKRLRKGDRLVSPGEVFNGLFLIVAGRLSVTRRPGAGKEQLLATLGRGQFFGVVSALSGNPCRCSIVAAEETTITFLPQREFNEFVKDHATLRLLPQRLAESGMLVEKDVFVGDAGIPGLS